MAVGVGASRCGPRRLHWRSVVVGLATTLLLTGVPASASSASQTARSTRHGVAVQDLVQLAMRSSDAGFGLFREWVDHPSGNVCRTFVASTADGGAHFSVAVPVPVTGCGWGIAVDAQNAVFVLGASLVESTSNGVSWATVHLPGLALQVDASGDSVWVATAECVAPVDAGCPIALSLSSNGGRTWTHDPTLPPLSSGQIGKTYLLRVGAEVGYVLARNVEQRGTLITYPMWRTTDGGRTWSATHYRCPAYAGQYVVAAAARDGALWVACAGTNDDKGKSQLKYVSESDDGGQTWTYGDSCSQPNMCGGQLEGIAALSSRTAFVAPQQSGGLEVSHDAGAVWAQVPGIQNDIGSRGPEQLTFLDQRVGFAGPYDSSHGSETLFFWTGNGGRTWDPREAHV